MKDIEPIYANGEISYDVAYDYQRQRKTVNVEGRYLKIANISYHKTVNIHVNGRTGVGTNSDLTLKTIFIPIREEINTGKIRNEMNRTFHSLKQLRHQSYFSMLSWCIDC